MPEANIKRTAAYGINWRQDRSKRAVKLGIIGYGHIGTQLGILAESLGCMSISMILKINCRSVLCNSGAALSELLNMSVWSVCTYLKTPPQKHDGRKRDSLMKPGSLLINAARGTVVDIPALCDALATKASGGGAAIDASKTEAGRGQRSFTSRCANSTNVILTPRHQAARRRRRKRASVWGRRKLIKEYSDSGSTLSAVNFPEVSLPLHGGRRLMRIHENRPGVTALSWIFAEQGVNIATVSAEPPRNGVCGN